MKEFTKGSIVMYHGWWYVVVKQEDDIIYCICDNANNAYSLKIDKIEHSYTPFQAVKKANWGSGYLDDDDDEDTFHNLVLERDIPVDVIVEVLAGCHEHRWTL